MFIVAIDTTQVVATLNGMVAQLTHFTRVDVGQVMSEWQTEDLHRHRPFTMRARSRGRASTIVRPHSRYEVNRSRMAQRRLARRAKGKNFTGSPIYRRWSTRPILRAEMFTDLETRLTDALAQIKWKK